MKVFEMIEWLKTQDQEADVEVLYGIRGTGWEGDSYMKVDFDPENHYVYTDMRGNRFAIGQPFENKRTLFIGGTD